MENTEYYNAKPSKVSNIGKDVSGARRMHYDTYETLEEREVKAKKKAVDSKIKAIKLEIKNEVLSTSPDIYKIIDLLAAEFELNFGFNPACDNARSIIVERRQQSRLLSSNKDFNRLVTSYNGFTTMSYRLKSYRSDYYIKKMANKYASKKTFTEQTGQSYDWKNFKLSTDVLDVTDYLSKNTSAVQFGNSVSDNERAFILSKMHTFLNRWNADPLFSKIYISKINWSFGARGKAGSVAYYQSSGKIISVNRNNIGSLIHELGHFIDDSLGGVSNSISFATISTYRDSIKDLCSPLDLNYYCSRSEIFARAFEAYCFNINANFETFAQCGSAFLPDLNEELIGLISKALQA